MTGFLLDGTSRLHKNGTEIRHFTGVSSFAEYAVVPESGIVKIRSDVPLEAAALVGCGVMTESEQRSTPPRLSPERAPSLLDAEALG